VRRGVPACPAAEGGPLTELRASIGGGQRPLESPTLTTAAQGHSVKVLRRGSVNLRCISTHARLSRCAPSRHRAEGHPQVLIIAQHEFTRSCAHHLRKSGQDPQANRPCKDATLCPGRVRRATSTGDGPPIRRCCCCCIGRSDSDNDADDHRCWYHHRDRSQDLPLPGPQLIGRREENVRNLRNRHQPCREGEPVPALELDRVGNALLRR
jgi:hypothetical protein